MRFALVLASFSTHRASTWQLKHLTLVCGEQTGTIVPLQSGAEDSGSGDEMPDEEALLGKGGRIDRPIDEGRQVRTGILF